MRSVRSVVSEVSSSLPALLAVGAFAACACTATLDSADAARGSGGGGGVTVAGAAAGAGGSAASLNSGGAGEMGGSGGVSLPPNCAFMMRCALAAGVPAQIERLCAETSEPVVSNAAARVALTITDGDLRKPAGGTLALAPSLRDSLLYAPVLSIVAPVSQGLSQASISALEPTPDGYAFVVTWPSTAASQLADTSRISFLAELDVGCESGSRLVHASTFMELCGPIYSGLQAWVPDGGMCVTCYQNQP